MKNRIFTLPLMICAAALIVSPLFSQETSVINKIVLGEKNFGGPRLGVTMVPGNTVLASEMKKKNIGRMLSQFGWHFEYQVVPDGGGPSFVIQFVPLVGGVEYGTLIPSGTLAMGVRLPGGMEFGLGPNAIITPTKITSALVMSVGQSFSYGGVNIPLNFVYATNPNGNRFSLVFGYAIQKTK
ncbi:MAG: hypothetical protein WCW40_07445 [Bacteroidota bacterium]